MEGKLNPLEGMEDGNGRPGPMNIWLPPEAAGPAAAEEPLQPDHAGTHGFMHMDR